MMSAVLSSLIPELSEQVWIAVVSFVTPAALAAIVKVHSSWMANRHDAEIAAMKAELEAGRIRTTDEEIRTQLRDELRTENADLRARVAGLEDENDELRATVETMQIRITRLEDALRRHGHADEIEGAAG